MDSQYRYEFTATPEERAARHAQRAAARKARKRAKRRRMLLRTLPLCLVVLVVSLALALATDREEGPADSAAQGQPGAQETLPAAPAEPPVQEEPDQPYSAHVDGNTLYLGGELPSAHAIVIDLNTGTILAQKAANTQISPASMTKILTLLVAAEHLEESRLRDTVTIDLEITDYCFKNDCSVAGFELDEAVPVEDLLYGCILPSGAEASLALARYVAGSHEAFVELMNEKAEQLGLRATARFSNCVGLYNEDNVCTVYDMAMILKAALDNDLARTVLTTKIYEIPANEFHEEGMILSNWFLRRIEDHICQGVEVLGAKTGYVDESGNCAASYAETAAGGHFLCVTADTVSAWQCIRDHVQLYGTYVGVKG